MVEQAVSVYIHRMLRNPPLYHMAQYIAPLLLIVSCTNGPAQESDLGSTSRPLPIPPDTAQLAEYIVSAFEDSKGHLWFGTNGQGVARWDGKELRYITTADGLIDNVVTGIAEDRSGHLWFGTQAGASRYDGGSFTGFGPAEGLPGAGCKVLVDRNGELWAGTSAGVFRFAADRFTPFTLPVPELENLSWKMNPGKVWDLFEDSKGNIWFGLDGHGAVRFDPTAALRTGGSDFKRFTKQDGLCSNNVSSIQEDAQGNIWFGSITSDHPRYIEEGGVSKYDGVSFTRYPELRGLSANDIYNIHADRAGNIWIGAVRVGAYRWDGKTFTLFDKTDRPDLTTYFAIQAFVEDRRGTLWFGFSGGLFRFSGTGFVNVPRGGPWD